MTPSIPKKLPFCLILHRRCQKAKKLKEINLTLCGEEGCSIFNGFFANTASNPNIPVIEHSDSNLPNNDPIRVTVNLYVKHQSIKIIKHRSYNSIYSFGKINFNKIRKIIDNLNIKKASQNTDIGTKIMKLNKDIIAPCISKNFNTCIDKDRFPKNICC